MSGETPPPSPAYNRDRLLAHAVRPTLFSAAAYPDLIVALVLANLMSPRLWELAARIFGGTLGGHRPHEGPLGESLHKIQRFVNAHFYHAMPPEFGRAWGLQERESTDDEELSAGDYAMRALKEAILLAHSTAYDYSRLVKLVDMGLFPQHVYSPVDVILAHGPRLSHMPGRPLGMTSCLDECVLIASLAIASGCCTLDDIVFLGSPSHYTLFIFAGGHGFWFNAKRWFFDEEAWRAACASSPGEDAQELVDRKLPVCDRIITMRGHCLFPGGQTTLGKERLEQVTTAMCRFEGIHSRQARQAMQCTSIAAPPADGAYEYLDGCSTRQQYEQRIVEMRDRPDWIVPLCALHVFRHCTYAAKEAIIEAAAHGFTVFVRSGEVLNAEDALDIARAIRGSDSIFQDPVRLALPDEVLFFDTADRRERALLAHTLISLSSHVASDSKSQLWTSADGAEWQMLLDGRPATL